MKKRKKENIIFGIVGFLVIIIIIGFFYSAEQTRNKGFSFGNDLQNIQEDLKKLQTNLQVEMRILEEGDITLQDFSDFAKKHIASMKELVLRYDALDSPQAFTSSVELFRLSTQSQLESDEEMIQWILEGDEGAKIRSDALIKDAFEYELAALEKYNAAKSGIDP